MNAQQLAALNARFKPKRSELGGGVVINGMALPYPTKMDANETAYYLESLGFMGMIDYKVTDDEVLITAAAAGKLPYINRFYQKLPSRELLIEYFDSLQRVGLPAD